MEKINFENLPSTNTPLNADTLNDMQDGIEKSANYIGSTQPSTGEKVWIKTGKNLIDYNSVMWGYALFNDGSINYDSNNWATTKLIAVNPNTIYIFSHELGTRSGRIGFYNNNKTFISLISDSNVTAFTTPSNAKYVAISVYDANEITTSRERWLQLEQSATATTYEPYIEKEILIKNNNNVFEKFYSEKLADDIICRSVTATFAETTTTGNSSVSITATVPSGYKFLCWVGVASTGWVSEGLYIDNYSGANATVWTGNSVRNPKTVTGYYLCIKNA